MEDEGSGHGLSYSTRLYATVLDWYKTADTKAQVILTLDGVFLSFVASLTLGRREDVSFNGVAWVFLGLMTCALVASVAFAVAALWSRLESSLKIGSEISAAGVDSSFAQVAWYFQYIARLNPAELTERVKSAPPGFEAAALIHAAHQLARNVERKHRFVNWGFVSFASTLLMFLLAQISQLVA